MRCRRTICSACTTRLDGVNHCHQCLKELGRRSARPRVSTGGVAAALMVLTACVFFLFMECLTLIEGRLAP
jgi:hypothetical protein